MAGLRQFVILERNGDGWIEHAARQAHTEALAIEEFANEAGKRDGRYVAVAASAWTVRELRPVTAVKAIVAETS